MTTVIYSSRMLTSAMVSVFVLIGYGIGVLIGWRKRADVDRVALRILQQELDYTDRALSQAITERQTLLRWLSTEQARRIREKT